MSNEPIGRQNGRAIRAIREEKRITVLKLAADVGLHQQSLRNIENGRRPASIPVIQSIARKLDVPVSAITRSGVADDIPEEDPEPEAAPEAA